MLGLVPLQGLSLQEQGLFASCPHFFLAVGASWAPEQGMYMVAFGHLRCPFQQELPDGQLRCVCPEVQDAATQS